MKSKTLVTSVLVGMLYFTVVKAQVNQEFSVYSGGGLSTLKYKTTFGDRKNGFGGLFGVGYHYFFTQHIGIGTGLEISTYRSKMLVDNLSDRYMTTDFDGDEFEFRTMVNNYKERQNAVLLNIPLMLQYQTGKHRQFYAAAGGKIGIPVSGKYKTSDATMKNSGYYAMEDYEYTTQEFLGFGTFAGKDMNRTINLKTAWMLSLETGIKWKLKENLFLYTGVYFDYGLNDIGKDAHTDRFVQYNRLAPSDFTTNSVLTSQYTHNARTAEFIGKVIPLAAGVKVRLAFGKTCGTEKVEPEPTPLPPNPPMPAVVEQPTDTIAPVSDVKPDDVKVEFEVTALPTVEKPEPVANKPLEEAKEEITGVVFLYPLNKAELNAQQKAVLDSKIALLKKYPDLKIICEGHTCSLGNDVLNMNLGLKRAENVKKYLVEKGIDASRISVTTKGKAGNVAPNDNEDNRLKNRRVEIRVVE